MADIPGSWPELRKRERAQLGDVTSELAFEADLVTGVLQRETATLTAAFSGSAEYLARMFVIGGADHARRHAYLANDALPRLLAHGDAPAREAPAAAVSALSYVALMRCLSVPLPGTAAGVESRWLTIIAERPDLLNEPAIRTAALAAVAAGETGLVPKLVGGGPLAARKTARQIAGPNVPGLARHLAEVLEGGGDRDAVEEAWWSFLEAFPMTLGSDGCRWVDLIWAAMAIMVKFEQRPVSEVAAWLPALVEGLE